MDGQVQQRLAAYWRGELRRFRSLTRLRAQDRAWSSVRAHLKGEDDGLVSVKPELLRIPDIASLLAQHGDGGFDALRARECTGRPLGNADFIAGLERILGRPVAKRAPGRKSNARNDKQGLLF